MGRSKFVSFIFLFVSALGFAREVRLGEGGLFVDGKKTPFLYGAELQYFRARGGAGRNVPAADVEKLWNKLLDRVVEAGMNSVTLYIPWDFHEPVEGIFDFEGKLDRDGDGRPDYPSRNVRRFLDLLIERGIEHVMVRPGPYINAEWGPEGFGAIPRWFLDRYPQALAKNQTPDKPRVVSFGHPEFRKRAARWFETFYREVLKDYVGDGKPVTMVQIDNETNYFWDSIYERDYSELSIRRYREFLRRNYRKVAALNRVYASNHASFDDVRPPKSPGDGVAKAYHYDWYRFHDVEILDYYRFLRSTWQRIGLREPTVLFTSCDSFNAMPNGLLPRLDYRQEGRLSLTTMNVYPKTFGTVAQSTMNTPMKAAHDARLVAASHASFYKTAGDWVMSTETVGGWFPPVEVNLAARQHTYGSLLGSGVKALNIYYFHEGWNWTGLEGEDTSLHFDAPLTAEMETRPAFGVLKSLGAALRAGLGDGINKSHHGRSPTAIVHASNAQYSVPGGGDALSMASTDSAALFGLFREAGIQPDLFFIDREIYNQKLPYRMLVWSHPGYLPAGARAYLQAYVAGGGTLVTLGRPTGLKKLGSGKLIELEKNPAEGWNSDPYAALADPGKAIARARELFALAGLKPQIEVITDDSQARVHAYTRRKSDGNFYLFVENFARKARGVTIKFGDLALDAKGTYQLTPKWGNPATAKVAEISGQTLLEAGGKLAVDSDSVGIWEFTRVR